MRVMQESVSSIVQDLPQGIFGVIVHHRIDGEAVDGACTLEFANRYPRYAPSEMAAIIFHMGTFYGKRSAFHGLLHYRPTVERNAWPGGAGTRDVAKGVWLKEGP